MEELASYVSVSKIYELVEEELGLTHEEQLDYINNKTKRILHEDNLIDFFERKKRETPDNEVLYKLNTSIIPFYDRIVEAYKNKMLKFYALCDLLASPTYTPDNEELVKYDINAVNGTITTIDLARLVKPMIYCFKKLQEYVSAANSFKTYVKENLMDVMRGLDGVSMEECIPDENLQCNDPLEYAMDSSYIPLSKKQSEQYYEAQMNHFANTINALKDI